MTYAEAGVDIEAGDALVDRIKPLARTGNITTEEMLRVFNCGIGMVLVVAPDDVDAALALLAEAGESAMRMGQLEAGGQGVVMEQPLAL